MTCAVACAVSASRSTTKQQEACLIDDGDGDIPASQARLLFVNKTLSSRSLSNSKDDTEGLREIQQHVQRSRDYKTEREARKRLKRPRVPLGWAPISAAPPKQQMSCLLPPQSESVSSTQHGTCRKTPLCHRPRALQIRRKEDTPVSSTNNEGQLDDEPPKPILGESIGDAMEQFGSLTLSMTTEEKCRILDYFVVKFSPLVTRLDMTAFMGGTQSPSASDNPAVQVVRNSLSDELHMLALLTAASARMKYVERIHFGRPDLPEQLADAALRLLRRYVAQGRPVTPELIHSMLCLWAIESYRRNWNAVSMHRNMIMYLVDTFLGGFGNLDVYIRRMLWVADRFQAAATQTPAAVQEMWETEDLSPQQYACALTAIRKQGRRPTGQGFAQLSQMFSPEFQKVLDEALHLCCIFQCHWIGVSETAPIPSRDWALARAYSIVDELLNFREESRGGSPLSQSEKLNKEAIQDCVRLALVVWLAFFPASPPYSPASRNITSSSLRVAIDARPLRKRLGGILASQPSCSKDESILLFWISALGAVASELTENQEWFAIQFQAFAKRLGVFSWQSFAPINESFLLLEHLQPANLCKLTWLLQRAVYADAPD